MPRESAIPDSVPRLAALDVARGVALGWMAVYHLFWDLTYFGIVRIDILGDPVWWVQPLIITGLFLSLVGASLSLATRQRRLPRHYLRRTALVGAAAAALTGATMVLFPDSFIFFGVLHCITAASLIGLCLARVPGWLLSAAAVAALALPSVAMPAVFDHPWLIWLGLGDRLPFTNDFVPLFPWLGVALAGMVAGRVLAARVEPTSTFARWRPQTPVAAGLGWLGRHSLVFYLVHQPVMLGILFALHAVFALGNPTFDHFFPDRTARANFLLSCEAACRASGQPADLCAKSCACVADQLADFDRWADAGAVWDPVDQTLIATLQRDCPDLVPTF